MKNAVVCIAISTAGIIVQCMIGAVPAIMMTV
jgi:hypothetical protein